MPLMCNVRLLHEHHICGIIKYNIILTCVCATVRSLYSVMGRVPSKVCNKTLIFESTSTTE